MSYAAPPRHARVLLAAAAILCATSTAVLVFSGAPSASATASARTDAMHKRTVAVIIGIDDYDDPSYDLRSSVRDAQTVDRALDRAGVDRADRKLLLDRDATAANIGSALSWLAANSTPDTTAVFFFAGHAQQIGTQQAVLTSDHRNVTDLQLAAQLRPVGARQMWIGMATCYGGGFDELITSGRVLTAAAGANEKAFENDKLGRSYLVDSLVVRGLNGDFSTRSIQSAFRHGIDQLRAERPDRLPVMTAASSEPLVVVAR